MTFSLTGWMLYTMWAVLGAMWLSFFFFFFRNMINGTFNLFIVLDYLKDMLYYILPLFLILSLTPLDPVGWIVGTIYLLASIGIFFHYVMRMAKGFKS